MLRKRNLSHFTHLHIWVYRFVGTLFLFAIPFWSLKITPELKKIPDTFSYTAEILSVDNFYDEHIKKFEGWHFSKTDFSYKVIAKNPSYLMIKNSFNIRDISEQPIFSTSRLYYIDPYNGEHVSIDKEHRIGYLFAPRYLNKKNFTYWHVNYNAPAQMKFVNVEKIYGLSVDHYQAQYAVEQPSNLRILPSLSKNRGIRNTIFLQLWIEPISGWLVKYQDNSFAYYYDIKTEKILAPWNTFSNRYTQNSIYNQVKIAKKLKWHILLIDFGVPLLLGILGIVLLLISLLKTKKTSKEKLKYRLTKLKQITLLSTLSIIIIFAGLISIYSMFLYKKPALYTVGISQWNNDPLLITAIKGFKDGLAEHGFREGINTIFIIKNPNSNIEKQINIIQSFIQDKVNLIYTLTTPGTFVAKGITTTIPIVFSQVTYPQKLGIIESLTSSKNNLVGIKSYIPPAQEYYRFASLFNNTKTLGFIHKLGDPDSEIQYHEYKTMLNQHNIAILDIAAVDIDDLIKQLKQKKNNYNALFISCDTLIHDENAKIVADYIRENKIPSFSCDKESLLNGILIGSFVDPYETGNLAGEKAGLILRGAEPRWLRTEFPERTYLVINLKTANLLSIHVPEEILQQADILIRD